MLKHTCCVLCLSINRRTINIYGTVLYCVYENLANFRISDDECWMCYICHTRLRQCHQLQQLAVQTRGLIDDILQNKINTKLETCGSLLNISTSRANITSLHPHIKQESDGVMESFYDHSIIQTPDKTNTKEYNSTTTLYIKQELDVDTKYCQHSEIKHNGFCENVYEVEAKQLLSKDALSIKQEVSNGIDKEQKLLELNIAELSQSVQHLTEPRSNSLDWRERIRECTTDVEIKREIEEIKDNGIEQDGQDANDINHISKARSGLKRPYTCEVCSKNFSWESDLRTHFRQHTGEKPFSCDLCSKRFTRKSSLNIHIQTHTGIKLYSCEICSKKFTQKSHLKVHGRTHTGSKPFGCDICPQRFLLKSNLSSHILTHTGEKPFTCETCQKKFSRKNDLNVHKRIHIGYKPFSCGICSKRFLQKSHLNGHVLTHRDK